jgi:6,7-dimethyl-8-ribityllumazine synthase
MPNYHIAVIVSRFNTDITARLREGALSRLKELGVSDSHIHVVEVPGAVEAPLIAKALAKTGRYQAMIVLGAVVQGETDHHLYVCQQVSDGCQQVMLEYTLPVVFGVLTTHTEEQAYARVGGPVGHKGVEAADTAIEMIELLQKLK